MNGATVAAISSYKPPGFQGFEHLRDGRMAHTQVVGRLPQAGRFAPVAEFLRQIIQKALLFRCDVRQHVEISSWVCPFGSAGKVSTINVNVNVNINVNNVYLVVSVESVSSVKAFEIYINKVKSWIQSHLSEKGER